MLYSEHLSAELKQISDALADGKSVLDKILSGYHSDEFANVAKHFNQALLWLEEAKKQEPIVKPAPPVEVDAPK